MNQLLLVVLLIAVGLLARWIWRQPRTVKFTWLVGILVLAVLVLAATGKIPWLISSISASVGALFLVFKKLWGLRWLLAFKRFYSNRSKQSRQSSNPNATRTTMRREEALKILGLRDTATRAEIIQAHKRLIQRMHPDRGGSPLIAQQINQAKKVLLNE